MAAAPAPPPGPPLITPAEIDNSLDVTGDPVGVREVNRRMLVDVRIDGKGPFRFFVDSGADRTVVGQALALRLALPPGPSVLLHSIAAARQVGTARVDRLQVGASTMEDLAAPVLPERFLGGDGLLGIDALADQRLTMDFDRKTVTIQDTHRPDPVAGPDEVIVVARRRKGQLILTQAQVGAVPVSAVIDSGTEITVANDALRQRLLRRPAPIIRADLVSVTGETIQADLLRVPRIRIGGLEIMNVTIAFADIPPFRLFGLEDTPALLLGSDVLESFSRVSLDFRRKKIRFGMRAQGR